MTLFERALRYSVAGAIVVTIGGLVLMLRYSNAALREYREGLNVCTEAVRAQHDTCVRVIRDIRHTVERNQKW